MAYLFIDDGHPEAECYHSNYIYFDESDPDVVKKMMEYARAHWARKNEAKNRATKTIQSSCEDSTMAKEPDVEEIKSSTNRK